MRKTAWFGKPKLKARVMEQLHEHRRMDVIAQGIYWEDGRGCHLGCLTHRATDARAATERLFGIPQRIAYWLESVFEGLPEKDCAQWVIDGTDAIPVGADMSLSHHQFAAWLLGPESPSAAGNAHPLVAAAVAHVRSLHQRAASGEYVSRTDFDAADSAARSAAYSAADSAARSAAWRAIAAKSIEIFKAAPIVVCEECDACIQVAMNHLANAKYVGTRENVVG